MTTTATTCPRCTKEIAPRTVTTPTADGAVHVHCATAEERNATPTIQPARRFRGEPARPTHKNWQWRGHLSLDC